MTTPPAQTPPASTPTSAIFTAAAALEVAEPRHLDLAFTGTTQPCPWPKAYGGDLVAQAAVAAMRSVDDGKTMHSMHSYFMRPAEIGAEVRYEVEVLRDGQGYSTRQVRAYQNDKTIYVCMASFARGEAGGSHHTPCPDGVPGPEELPSSADYLARHGGRLAPHVLEYWSGGRSFDMRHVPGPVYVEIDGARVPHQAVWVKPFDDLRAVAGLTDAQRDVAALAYVCDYTILEPMLRVLGLPWADENLVTASLDHAMWFHRPPHLDGWLLYAQEAVAADHGRGLGIGRFFDSTRTHLATVVQEGMIRHTVPESSR